MPHWIERLAELHRANAPAALVTLVRGGGSAPSRPGARMVVEADGAITGSIGGGRLERELVARACVALARGENGAGLYRLADDGEQCGGSVECFVELFGGGPQLYLFGAGHVGKAVCRVLAESVFRIHLIDDRPEQLYSDRVPAPVLRHQGCEAFLADFAGDAENGYAAIFTHSHDLDCDVARQLAVKPLRYLGLIGSHAKWHSIRQQLLAHGLSEADVGRITCPMGNKIGNGPTEVAVSLAAEILAIHHHGQGGRVPPVFAA